MFAIVLIEDDSRDSTEQGRWQLFDTKTAEVQLGGTSRTTGMLQVPILKTEARLGATYNDELVWRAKIA